MNYEKLTKLAELLNEKHGESNRHGFIVAPHSESQLREHTHALAHSDRIFNYEPISDERLGIYSVTRNESASEGTAAKVDYSHDRLEHMKYDTLATPEISPLLDEYIEHTKCVRD